MNQLFFIDVHRTPHPPLNYQVHYPAYKLPCQYSNSEHRTEQGTDKSEPSH